MKNWTMPEVIELNVELTADGTVMSDVENVQVGCYNSTTGKFEDYTEGSTCNNVLKSCES